MSKTNEEIIKNLLAAKEYLQTHGRITGELYDPETGCACLLGGVGIAVLSDDFKTGGRYGRIAEGYKYFDPGQEAYDEVKALAASVHEVLPTNYEEEPDMAVWRFNDVFAGEGPSGDKKVFDLIDRTVARLSS
ncbi:hypothetical protein SEA_BLINN1_72 [Mycobacterium phage Blinn1]|uniref:Uncharacterized protein n=1 Tax=Mycobacterium phage Blinn1 TaxID=2656562 RepID=A0A649VSA7_9CAUD|nr:hypothetical protein KIP53_gp037 [Mycobacterium phage Blinn1]QGJ94832.1 hypothetical protein SEA_BLINN1_72 [Mycobacterium phage Blinn1]